MSWSRDSIFGIDSRDVDVRAKTLTLHTTVYLHNPPGTINKSRTPFAFNTADTSRLSQINRTLPRQERNTQCTEQLTEVSGYRPGSPDNLICQRRSPKSQTTTEMINSLCENLGSTEDTRPTLQAEGRSVEAGSNRES